MSDVDALRHAFPARRRVTSRDEVLPSACAEFSLTLPGFATSGQNATNDSPIVSQLTRDVQATVEWMRQGSVDLAVMKLAPEGCGSLEIQLTTTDQTVRVAVSCTSIDTREALHALLPSLRQSFASRGISLIFEGISMAGGATTRRPPEAMFDDFA